MIPIHLSLSGFLSYRDPVEVDFTTFNLACISGPNGAGKSSLLDAVTWALFGQARKRDDSLINTSSETAEVSFTFAYEGDVYRVQRAKPRDKTTVLEFHIQTPGNGVWKPLTERTMRETEARIQSILRLDYETFVNAAFFLQGKADQFTQQRPADRKRILSSILGLEVWEDYRKATFERRKRVEAETSELEGRLQEINAELAEEQERKKRLKELEADLKRLSKTRAAQEEIVEEMRRRASALAEQEKLVGTLAAGLERARAALEETETRLAQRQQEQEALAETIGRAGEIEAAHQAWQQARAELERWEEVSARFHEHEKRRHEPLTEIETARARLEAELEGLRGEQAKLETAGAEAVGLEKQLSAARAELKQVEEGLAQRAELEEQLGTARQRQAEARAENPRLKAEMDELKERIDQLKVAEGATCPLCGQPLAPQEREKLVVELSNDGKERGDRYRANQALVKEADQTVNDLEAQIAALAPLDEQHREGARVADQLAAEAERIEASEAEWKEQGAPRLEEIEKALKEEGYAAEARAALTQIDAELKEIGYDAAAHDGVRKVESEQRAAEADLRALENARAALAPLEREIKDIQAQIEGQREEIARQEAEHDQAAAALAAAQAEAPDVESAEAQMLDLQEQENKLRLEVGAAQQKVLVLDDLKARRADLEVQREELARRTARLKSLERAFGKDGVPAMLIEQALPQIESKANEVLERLSGGNMSVRFLTQQAYKDKRRDDLRETLDIQISDSAGVRDYEMYSGGEAFRINFAIRLALSEVLAQRAGARLQTLVVDEGFGSQDAVGRQRLIEAINLVKDDFAKILVITHIEALKDVFPYRIEVEKTPRGSMVNVV